MVVLAALEACFRFCTRTEVTRWGGDLGVSGQWSKKAQGIQALDVCRLRNLNACLPGLLPPGCMGQR